MKSIAMMPREQRGASEELRTIHPLATAFGVILALAFGLYCLCASAMTSFR
jgi:hypothetical protein